MKKSKQYIQAQTKAQKNILIVAKFMLGLFSIIFLLLILSFITEKKSERFYESTAHITDYKTIVRSHKRLAVLIDDNDQTRMLYRVGKGCNERPVGSKTKVSVKETETTTLYYFKYKTYYIIEGNICL
jgi:hypothetical protein